MLQVHVRYSSSRKRELKFSIKQILRLPYLKGVSADQPPKLFAHYSRILNTSGSGIRGGVHNILISDTLVQDVEHETVVLLGQILSLQFQAMGSQDLQTEKLVIKDQADGKGQRIFTLTHKQSTLRYLIMVNKICQQRHIIIDQPVEQPDRLSFQYDGARASNPWEPR